MTCIHDTVGHKRISILDTNSLRKQTIKIVSRCRHDRDIEVVELVVQDDDVPLHSEAEVVFHYEQFIIQLWRIEPMLGSVADIWSTHTLRYNDLLRDRGEKTTAKKKKKKKKKVPRSAKGILSSLVK